VEKEKIKRVKLSLFLIKHHAMKVYGAVEPWLHAFITLALGVAEWLA
jgi:hypothetical protein